MTQSPCPMCGRQQHNRAKRHLRPYFACSDCLLWFRMWREDWQAQPPQIGPSGPDGGTPAAPAMRVAA